MNSILTEEPSVDDQVEELDENSFYHHPTWTQRWSHPDFTSEAMRAWRNEDWYNHSNILSCIFLRRNLSFCFPWGYIIYRTVYTIESDELWPLAMAKLTRCINNEIEYPDSFGNNPRPERLAQESYKNVVISDKQRWNGAGIEQIRQHFANYLRKTKLGLDGGCGRFRACMVIDERSLKSIIACPEPDSEDRFTRPDGFVGMVDGMYDPERKDNPRYSGFMRVKIGILWWLYINLRSDPMEEVCPSVPPEFIPVYDGCDGEAQDEEGNTHKFPRRPAGLASRARE